MLTESDSATVSVLSRDCLLVRTAHCSVRPQGAQYLIYNTKTDELHLISALAAYLVELCNGLNSLGDLTQMFSAGSSDTEEVEARLSDFFLQLMARGVLEARPQ